MWHVFQTIVFSLLLILICHYGYQYIKDWLTPQKKRDLVDSQIKKYKKMLEEIIEKQNSSYLSEDAIMSSKTPFYEPSIMDDSRSEMDAIDYQSMQDELMDFAKLI